MKVLLDECVDRRLAREIAGHEVVTVPDAGWASIKNGDLLSLAEKKVDALVTVDRNLQFQQNLSRLSIAVLILRAPTNRLLEILPTAGRGKITWIER